MIGPIAGAIGHILSNYLEWNAARRKARQRGNRQWVEYGPAWKILVAVFFTLSTFVTYAALQASTDQIRLALIIAAFFWFATMYVAYEVFFMHLSFDDEFIYDQTLLRRQRKIPWSAVKALRYSRIMTTYTLKTHGYGDVSISPYADGHQTLIARVYPWLGETPKIDQR